MRSMTGELWQQRSHLIPLSTVIPAKAGTHWVISAWVKCQLSGLRGPGFRRMPGVD